MNEADWTAYDPGLRERVHWISESGAINGKPIGIDVRRQAFGGHAPDALGIFAHRQTLTGKIPSLLGGDWHHYLHVFGVGGAEPESHSAIRRNFRRTQFRHRRCPIPVWTRAGTLWPDGRNPYRNQNPNSRFKPHAVLPCFEAVFDVRFFVPSAAGASTMMDPCGPASRINFLINCLSSRNPLISIDKTASITVVIYSSRMPSVVPGTHFRFGPFELDAAKGELRKHGIRVRLPNQPSQVLTTLLVAANRIVTREELRQQIWSGNTFVDFEHGLSVAVNKLRQALTDTAENPRYIETLPGRGYRFIAPVETVRSPEPKANGTRPSPPPPLPLSRMWMAALAVFLIGAITGWLIRPQQAVVASPVQFTVALPQDLFSEPAFNGQDFAISPDGRQLAFVASDPVKSGLWIRRLGSLDPARLVPEHNVRSLEWSSDGSSIYFGEMGILRRVSAAGGAAETVYELPSGAGDWNSLVE